MAKSTTHLKIKNLKENHHSGGCSRLTIKGKKGGFINVMEGRRSKQVPSISGATVFSFQNFMSSDLMF